MIVESVVLVAYVAGAVAVGVVVKLLMAAVGAGDVVVVVVVVVVVGGVVIETGDCWIEVVETV